MLLNPSVMKNFQQKTADSNPKNLKLQPPSVTEYMVTQLITFKPETEISAVITSFLDNRITGAPVLNDNKEVVGLIDDKDCLKVLVSGGYYNHPIEKETVASYMTNVMKTISIHDNIVDVANIFLQTKFKRLLVMDDNNKLVGQISRRDILRAIKDMATKTW
jgi:predicted transcriptional regulator